MSQSLPLLRHARFSASSLDRNKLLEPLPTGEAGALPGERGERRRRAAERELAPVAVAPVYGLDTLLTKGDGGPDGVFGFPERALAGLGWANFR